MGDHNIDCTVSFPSVIARFLTFWDHLLSITLPTRRALSWDTSAASILSLFPVGPLSSLTFKDDPLSMTLLTQDTLCPGRHEWCPWSLSPKVIAKRPLKGLIGTTFELHIWSTLMIWIQFHNRFGYLVALCLQFIVIALDFTPVVSVKTNYHISV